MRTFSTASPIPLSLVALIATVFAPAALAQGTDSNIVVTLEPDRDNTIYELTPGNSNGSGGQMVAGLSGSNSGFGRRRALLRFDVGAAVPAHARIVRVDLDLTLLRVSAVHPAGTMHDVALHRVTADWGEGGSSASVGGGGAGQGAAAVAPDATWNDRRHPVEMWNTPGGDFEVAASAAAPIGTMVGATHTVASTPALVTDVQGWLGGTSNFGWIVLGDEQIQNSGRVFATREASNASQRPRLRIVYDPNGFAMPFGAGCDPAGSPEPALSVDAATGLGRPAIGSMLRLVITPGASGPFATTAIAMSLDALATPLSLSFVPGVAAGCELHLDTGTLLTLPAPAGAASIALPNDPGLLGAGFFWQGIGVSGPILLTNALETRVGN